MEITSTKHKILVCATDLFASKGYTETTIRELATAAGIKEASLYNHFPSKNAILEYILKEHSEIHDKSFFYDRLHTLKENPTAEGILSCMKLVFPEGKEEYYLKQLYVILQEQHRNPAVREFVSQQFILNNEKAIKTLIHTLMEFGILRKDTDADFWAKTHSSLLYAFSSRSLLGIGDNEKGYTGMDMSQLLLKMYEIMLKTCGVKL